MENSDSIQQNDYLESFDPELRRAYEFANQSVDPALVDYSKVKMAKDSLLLSGDGVFYTLQGEGPTTGLPCVFVRLHVCNLRCDWCDAWYTWNPKTPEYWTEPRRESFDRLADRIQREWTSNTTATDNRRIIFTGGEPLIQRKQLDELITKLNGKHVWRDVEHAPWAVEFETNGTLMPTELQLATCQFNCSPKLANSKNAHHSMIKPKVLEALTKVNTTFKFVCWAEEDLQEIEDKYLPHIDEDKIIIMPQGITEEEVSINAKILVEFVKKRGWRLMTRLQNVCWDGARRGV